MHHGACITSIDSLKDPTISQNIADDADWLDKITLDSSDYIHPSPKINIELADEDAALAAHLWDRQHASDPDAYEWNSDDLVSDVDSHEDAAFDEHSPRLARIDEFERGIRREGTWNREYRERWEEPHIFYKRNIQERFGGVDEDGEDFCEEESCFSEGACSARAGGEWGTPSGEGWSVRSGEDWVDGNGWGGLGWEDREPGVRSDTEKTQEEDNIVPCSWGWEDRQTWVRSDTEKTQDKNSIAEERTEEASENDGELYLRARAPDSEPALNKSASNQPSSTPHQPHFTNPTPISSPQTGIPVTDLNTISSLRRRPTPRTSFTHPKQTSRFRDPPPIPVTTDPTSSSPDLALAPCPQATDHFLDSCISKTQTLLAEAEMALDAPANVDEEISQVADTGNEEASWEAARRCSHVALLKSSEALMEEGDRDITALEVVRVQGWWKVKGGEAWREVGEDLCATFCEWGLGR